MHIRSKIILTLFAFVVLFGAQTGFFYFQQNRFDALLRHEFNGSAVSVSTPDDSLKSMSALIKEDKGEMLLACLGALVLGVVASLALIKSIVPPLRNAVAVANSITIGYLENSIDTSGKGEAGDLLRALAAMQQALVEVNRNLERQVRETEVAYFDIERSASELSAAHARVEALNASMGAMLDALDQGLFLFDAAGVCSDVFSKACVGLLGGSPAGRPVAELLNVPPEEGAAIERLLRLIFLDSNLALDVEELLAMFPGEFFKPDGTRVSLTYHPIQGEGGKILSILAVATDHAAEEQALQQMQARENEAMSVLRISGNRNMFTQFYRSLTGFFSNSDAASYQRLSPEMIRRDIHTFKGNASIFHLRDIGDFLQGLETRLAPATDAAHIHDIIKSELPRLQAILTQTHKQAYDILGRDFEKHGITRVLPLDALGAMADRLKAQTANDDLYQQFVETLMGEPVRKSLASFDINIQELADRYGKKISPCYFTGDNFMLLTENYQPLFASLAHIARNIIGHAIDEPALRAERNKDPQVTVVIETRKYKADGRDWFSLSFEDDGNGLDVPLLRQKIAANGSPEEAARLSDAEVMQCIFHDNLSTKSSVDELAGRGVGLSAVKYEAEKLGGRVAVTSEAGVFTKITIDAPIIWSNPPEKG